MAPFDFVETAEARALRERHNALGMSVSAGHQAPPAHDFIEMPTPAGSAYLDLADASELNDANVQHLVNGAPHEERRQSTSPSNFAAGLRDSFSKLSAARKNSELSFESSGSGNLRSSQHGGLGMVRSMFGHVLGGRLLGHALPGRGARPSFSHSEGSRDASGPSRTGVEAEDADLETLTIELLAEIGDRPDDLGAEQAKLLATRTAQLRELVVTREMQVRKKWRESMGTAPGIKAEIAKLHATERAKLAAREFELHARAGGARPRLGASAAAASPVAWRPAPMQPLGLAAAPAPSEPPPQTPSGGGALVSWLMGWFGGAQAQRVSRRSASVRLSADVSDGGDAADASSKNLTA